MMAGDLVSSGIVYEGLDTANLQQNTETYNVILEPSAAIVVPPTMTWWCEVVNGTSAAISKVVVTLHSENGGRITVPVNSRIARGYFADIDLRDEKTRVKGFGIAFRLDGEDNFQEIDFKQCLAWFAILVYRRDVVSWVGLPCTNK